MKKLLTNKNIPSPCYILDLEKFKQNLTTIRSIQEQSGATIILALKGFAMWSMFPLMKTFNINGASASSLAEVLTVRDEFGYKSHTYSPAYRDDEIENILYNSSHITFNSLNQFERFKDQARNQGVSIGVRINPEYSETETELYDPCAPGSRLGILAEDLPTILPSEIEGFHLHNLCEGTAEALQKTLENISQKFGTYLSHLKWINFGGGHLMTHKNYNRNLLVEVIKDFKRQYNLEIILEPGSAFGWDCGYLLSTVLDIVENKNIKTAILDTSFTCHMPDCLEMPYQPDIINAQKGNQGEYVYRFGGNSCLAGDYMGDWSFEQALEVGCRLLFNDMIHYTMVKTTNFNGINLPAIGIVDEEGNFETVKAFDYSAYKSRLS